MFDLQTRIFIGTDADDATAQLQAALEDGSFLVLRSGVDGVWYMWITHRPVPGQAMLPPGYELHVTAWVDVDVMGSEQLEAIEDKER